MLPWLILIPILVEPASFAGNRFEEFVHGLECANHILSNPIYTWLIPPWLSKVNDAESKNSGKELECRLADGFESLGHPSVDLFSDYPGLADSIRNYLPTIKFTGKHEDEAIKAHVASLFKACQGFGEWLAAAKPEMEIAMTAAVMIGISDSQNTNSLKYPESTRFTFHGIADPQRFTRVQLKYAANFIWMLDSYEELVPQASGVYRGYFNLGSLAHTAHLSAESVASLLELLPIGHPVTISLLSKGGQASVLDLIKAEDGLVYGVKYTHGEYLPLTLAFALPHHQLRSLITFLGDSYITFQDIDTLPQIMTKEVQLGWYPHAKIKSPAAMVQRYAFALADSNSLAAGIVWMFYRDLHTPRCEAITKEIVADRSFLLHLIANLSPTMAEILVEKISKVTRGEADSLMAEILHHLQLRII